MHEDAADRHQAWQPAAMTSMQLWMRRLAKRNDTDPLVRELRIVLERCDGSAVHTRDIVHNDFSHRNYLAIGDKVTGVVDWELATIGDWRLDLVSLAYGAAMQPSLVDDDTAVFVLDRAREACAPDVLALFAAYLSLRHLDYDARAHPARIAGVIDTIEHRIAPWWRWT
jgi:aminoglycoside phosphotransferase (APT) family kinase protein